MSINLLLLADSEWGWVALGSASTAIIGAIVGSIVRYRRQSSQNYVTMSNVTLAEREALAGERMAQNRLLMKRIEQVEETLAKTQEAYLECEKRSSYNKAIVEQNAKRIEELQKNLQELSFQIGKATGTHPTN